MADAAAAEEDRVLEDRMLVEDRAVDEARVLVRKVDDCNKDDEGLVHVPKTELQPVPQ